MSIGLMLEGKLKLGKQRAKGAIVLADTVESWLRDRFESELYKDVARHSGDEVEHIYLPLHPAAEDVIFAVEPSGKLTVSANTGWGGPGYHRHVCELLDAMSESLGFDWSEGEDLVDETGYFADRDWSKLQAEVYDWFGGLCKVLVDQHGSGEIEGALSLGLPMDVHFSTAGFALTPLGPRELDWFIREVELSNSGSDVLAWTGESEDAHCFRGRALAAMWTVVRWCRPRTQAELLAHEYALHALNRAHDLDPGMELPWREWKQLAELTDQPVPLTVNGHVARAASGRLVGYRRDEVVLHPYAGWSITLPGGMSEDVEDGCLIWFDEDCVVRFSTMSISGAGSDVPQAAEIMQDMDPPPGDDLGTWEHNGSLGRMAVGENLETDGVTTHNFQALVTACGGFGICTVTATDRAVQSLAMRVARSIHGPAELVQGDQ